MSKPTGIEVATLAETLADGKRIPYVYGHETLTSADCQGFVEAVVRKLGGKMQYRGSNHMFRAAVDVVMPLDVAKKNNALKPGGLLFILQHDGGERERGYKDGLGNATHVGFYTGQKYFSVHSSSAKNDVVGTDDKYPWTHYGNPVDIDVNPASKPIDNTPEQQKTLENVLVALEAAVSGLKKHMGGG